MSKIHQFISYISYWLNEENEHSLHAPFIYDLYKKVIKKKYKEDRAYKSIEQVRKGFLDSEKSITIHDFGSGSNNASDRKISKIAQYGISRKSFSQLFDSLINYLEATEIIELGTSLGVNTLYLANGEHRNVTTFEGAPALCAIAQAVFDGNGKTNIKIVEGDINTTLPDYLERITKVDLAFIDANHKYQPTLQYFDWLLKKAHDKTCFVFDDIHRNKEMEAAWRKLNESYEVALSIDLYQVGLVFINPELRKQSYTLKF